MCISICSNNTFIYLLLIFYFRNQTDNPKEIKFFFVFFLLTTGEKMLNANAKKKLTLNDESWEGNRNKNTAKSIFGEFSSSLCCSYEFLFVWFGAFPSQNCLFLLLFIFVFIFFFSFLFIFFALLVSSGCKRVLHYKELSPQLC